MFTASAWNAHYAGVEHPFCTATEPALTSRIDTIPAGRAIDLGCGLGRHARYLAERGWSVHGVDFSRVAVEIATAADGPEVDYLVADVTRWRPPEPVDLVLLSFVHLRLGDLGTLVAAARTWLTPGGHLLYLGHVHHADADPTRVDYPAIADLARACDRMRIDAMSHIVRSHVDTTTIDVVLHARTWWSQNLNSATVLADHGTPPPEPRPPASARVGDARPAPEHGTLVP